MNKRKREKKKLTAVGILLFVVMVALSLFTAFDCDVFGTFFDDVANDESLAICRLVVSLGLIFTSRLLRWMNNWSDSGSINIADENFSLFACNHSALKPCLELCWLGIININSMNKKICINRAILLFLCTILLLFCKVLPSAGPFSTALTYSSKQTKKPLGILCDCEIYICLSKSKTP